MNGKLYYLNLSLKNTATSGNEFNIEYLREGESLKDQIHLIRMICVTSNVPLIT